jgi:hypothetical protein
MHTLLVYGPTDRADATLRSVASRELAGRDLTRAWMTLDGDDDVRLDTIAAAGWHPADTLTAEALARGADEIVLADPGASGLGRLERRRLRRRSPLPVSAGCRCRAEFGRCACAAGGCPP